MLIHTVNAQKHANKTKIIFISFFFRKNSCHCKNMQHRVRDLESGMNPFEISMKYDGGPWNEKTSK